MFFVKTIASFLFISYSARQYQLVNFINQYSGAITEFPSLVSSLKS